MRSRTVTPASRLTAGRTAADRRGAAYLAAARLGRPTAGLALRVAIARLTVLGAARLGRCRPGGACGGALPVAAARVGPPPGPWPVPRGAARRRLGGVGAVGGVGGPGGPAGVAGLAGLWRGMVLLLVAWLLAGAVPVAAAGPTLKSSFAGFTDVNGNGVLDCGEPVDLVAAFATNNSGTPALTGSLFVPVAGSSGIVFQAGSVRVDPDLTNGCMGTVVSGNNPGDVDARVDFSCPADPIDNNSWTLVVRYVARYTSSSAAAFTAAAQASTSDGASYRDAVTVPAAGSVCSGGGAPNATAITKTAAGPATPGSVLIYTVTATDQSGLGAGGVQIVEGVPAHTTFSAAGSSPGWECSPGPGGGAQCRNPVSNLNPNGSLSAFFAVTLDPTLPAAPVTLANTACVRAGLTVAGCASLSTAAAGTPTLHLAKSLAPGPPQTAAPGATLTYALAAANSGNQDLADAVLEETVPALTSFSPSASSPGWACVPAGGGAGAACTLDLGALGAGTGGGRTFAVVVENPLPVLPPGYVISNTACLHTAAAGVADSCSTVGVPAAGMPLLQIVKTVASGSGAPGAMLVYDLALQNTGNEAALVVDRETVPAHTTFAAAASSPGWSCNPASGAAGAACALAFGPPLAAGATFHALFAVIVDRPLAAGVTAVVNTACGQIDILPEAHRREAGRGALPGAARRDARKGAGRAAGRAVGMAAGRAAGEAAGMAAGMAAADQGLSCDTVTTPTLGHPVLTLEKSYGGGPAAAGALLSFLLTAANGGDQDAAGVTVTETVPAHTTFAAGASSPGWSCVPASGAAGAGCTLAVGGLAAGGSAVATFAVRADSPLPAGVEQIGNVACAAATGLAPACGQATTPPPATTPVVVGELRDSFVKDLLGTALAIAGDDLAYTLTITNGGAAAALDLVVAVPLDPHLTLDAGSVTSTAGMIAAGNAPGDTVPVVRVASLAAGASFTVYCTATVGALPPGLQFISTQATLTGDNFSPTVSDDPDTPEPLDPTTTPVGVPRISSIPTLGGWGLLALGAGLGGISLRRMRGGRSGRMGGGGAGRVVGAGGAALDRDEAAEGGAAPGDAGPGDAGDGGNGAPLEGCALGSSRGGSGRP
jgi:uncharacterized repeat protein (TIGR01451 family)